MRDDMKQWGLLLFALLLLTGCGESLNLGNVEPESCNWKTVGISGSNDDGRVDILVNETEVTDGCIRTITNAAEEEMGKIKKLTVEIYQADDNNKSVFGKNIATLNLTQDDNNQTKIAAKRNNKDSGDKQNTGPDTASNNLNVEGLESIQSVAATKQSESNKTMLKEYGTDENSLLDEFFLQNLAEGKIKYCELPLDANITAQQIISKLGTPDYEDFRDGGYGRQYQDCTYFVDSKNPGAHMSAIIYTNSKMKHTPSEVKNILGEPIYEGINEMDDTYFLEYISKGYSAVFYFENENEPFFELFMK